MLSIDDYATGWPGNLGDLLDHPDLSRRTADVCDGIDVEGKVAAVFHLASPPCVPHGPHGVGRYPRRGASGDPPVFVHFTHVFYSTGCRRHPQG